MKVRAKHVDVGSGGIVTGVWRHYHAAAPGYTSPNRVLFTIRAGGPLASGPPGGGASAPSRYAPASVTPTNERSYT